MIRRPIELLLWGGDDPMGGVDIAERFSAKIPGATLEVLDGAGHAPWVVDPEGPWRSWERRHAPSVWW